MAQEELGHPVLWSMAREAAAPRDRSVVPNPHLGVSWVPGGGTRLQGEELEKENPGLLVMTDGEDRCGRKLITIKAAAAPCSELSIPSSTICSQ